MAVTFEDARDFWEKQYRLLNAYVDNAIAGRGVDLRLLRGMEDARAAYQELLGDQPDPYADFEDYQRKLLRYALRNFATAEGRQAREEHMRNEILPTPPPEGWEDDPRFIAPPSTE